MLSVSRLDYTKGIPAMLNAIEYFLEKMPRSDITFLVIAVPSRDSVQSYIDLKESVVKKIGEINGKYSQISSAPPIQFINYSVNMNKLAALYSIADVALVLPFIDGMNLVAKEFLAVQPGEGEPQNALQRPGTLVVSEFTGASQELFNALIVNPYDVRGVAEAIEKGLNMDPKEKISQNNVMRMRVRYQDADYWANRFLAELSRRDSGFIPDDCRALAIDEVVESFRAAKQRKALFLDYDGTLVPIVSTPQLAVPSERVLSVLELLSNRKDVDVYIISGRPADFLTKHFGHLNVALVAEHGFKVRLPGEEWKHFKDFPLFFDWKEKVRPYVDAYVRDTPGSFLEEKQASLVWHYRKSELELGQKRAADLVGQLSEFVSNLPIEIHHGKKIVEISSIEIGKGKILERYMRENDYDIAFCAGDDTTDENMFKLPFENLVKVKIGDGDTCAPFRWQKPETVIEFLESI